MQKTNSLIWLRAVFSTLFFENLMDQFFLQPKTLFSHWKQSYPIIGPIFYQFYEVLCLIRDMYGEKLQISDTISKRYDPMLCGDSRTIEDIAPQTRSNTSRPCLSSQSSKVSKLSLFLTFLVRITFLIQFHCHFRAIFLFSVIFMLLVSCTVWNFHFLKNYWFIHSSKRILDHKTSMRKEEEYELKI